MIYKRHCDWIVDWSQVLLHFETLVSLWSSPVSSRVITLTLRFTVSVPILIFALVDITQYFCFNLYSGDVAINRDRLEKTLTCVLDILQVWEHEMNQLPVILPWGNVGWGTFSQCDHMFPAQSENVTSERNNIVLHA